ncbi:hypothetical protein [Rhodanobacter lindaniclasticus]|nr:hypothetical protein [Rhodanobacter lindaniclasticus]
MSRHIHGFNESKGYCSETCPDVDSAFSDAWEEIKDMVAPRCEDEAERAIDMLCEKVKKVGTEKLREALCSAISDKMEAEGERDDLKRQVSDLESEIASLKDELSLAESA